MNQRISLITGGVLAGLGVAIGAFGAHGLKDLLTANNRADTFELAVRYQFYHAFAILITALLMTSDNASKLSRVNLLFLVGILIFSGSLYALSLTGITKFGMITPLGGVSFIAGWVIFVITMARKSSAIMGK